MTFTLLLNILQVTTSVALVATLIAALRQLRIMKNQLVTTAQWTITQDERNIWQIAIENPALGQRLIAEQFAADNQSNSPCENLLIAMLFNHYEKVFFLYVNGAISEGLWQSWEKYIVNTLSLPSILPCWRSRKHVYWADFVEHFCPLVADAECPDLRCQTP